MRDLIDIEILDGGEAVAVTLPDGERHRFHAVWLRDNAWDETTRASGNGQRLITLGRHPCRHAHRSRKGRGGTGAGDVPAGEPHHRL